MASADAVFLAAHYKAIQRKFSESSEGDDQRHRSHSVIDNIRDGFSKLGQQLSEKRKNFSGMRRRTQSCDVPDSARPQPFRPGSTKEPREHLWSQKSMDEKIPEIPEGERQVRTTVSGKTAQDLINLKRGRLHSEPVGRGRADSTPVQSPVRERLDTTETEDADDVFGEEENIPKSPTKDVKDVSTRL